jgi:hypothetical protein
MSTFYKRFQNKMVGTVQLLCVTHYFFLSVYFIRINTRLTGGLMAGPAVSWQFLHRPPQMENGELTLLLFS